MAATTKIYKGELDALHRHLVPHGHHSLRSATCGDLSVPFARTATMQQRTFYVVGPAVWNRLPPELRSLPRDSSTAFFSALKTTVLFRQGWAGSASQ